MSSLVAILCALAVVAAQVLHGGFFVPILSEAPSLLLVVACVPLLAVIWGGKGRVGVASFLAAMVFVAYLAWRSLHGADEFLGRVELGQVLAGSTAFVLASMGMGTTRARMTFLGVVGLAALVQAGIGFFQFTQGTFRAPLGWFSLDLMEIYQNRFTNRAHGLFLNPNQFAWLMTGGALFSVSLACWGRMSVISRIVLGYLALVFLAAAILSGSRGGLLSLLSGLLAFGLISCFAVMTMLRRGRWPMILTAVGLVILCSAVGTTIYSSNWVMQGRVDSLQVITDVRKPFFEHAVRQFQTAPLIGEGPGAFVYAARLYRTGYQPNDAVYVHDDWLQVLVDHGFIGFALAILAVLLVLGAGLQNVLRAVRLKAEERDRPQSNTVAILLGALSASLAFGVHSFLDFNMHVPANALLAAVVLGMVISGAKSGSPEKRLQASLAKTGQTLVAAAFAAALGLYLWMHAPADYHGLQARNRLASGDVWSALEFANAGLLLDPRNAALLATRAEALFSYESALQVDRDAEIKTPVALARLREWTPSKRAEVFGASAADEESALRVQPKERLSYVGLANARAALHHSASAQAAFLKAITLDPWHAVPYGQYADYLYEQGQFMRALRFFDITRNLSGNEYTVERFQDLMDELHPDEDPVDEESHPEPAQP